MSTGHRGEQMSCTIDGNDHDAAGALYHQRSVPVVETGGERQPRLSALRRSASDEQPLHGRDREWTQLIKVYRRAMSSTHNTEERKNVVLISGCSGVGKSALAQKLKRETKADGGWFIAGKFDMLQQAKPYSAFIQAFSEFARLVANIDDEDDTLMKLRDIVRGRVRNPEILTTMIPDLCLLRLSDEQVGSPKSPIEKETDGRAMKTRFLTTFRDFLRAIGSLGCPLVILLDDVHLAGEGSFELLTSLLDDKQIQHVLFVCTSESKIPHLEKGPQATTELLLSNLTATDTQQAFMALAGVRKGQDSVVGISEFLHQATNGNCALLRQLLLFLEESAKGSHDGQDLNEQWQYLDQFCNDDELTIEDVVRKRISRLPKGVQDVLAYAAFVGYDIDEVLLCKILKVETVQPYLKEAELYGLIRYVPERSCHKFCHDSIQTALLSTVPSEAHRKRHLAIGRQLWKSVLKNPADSGDDLFVVLDQIRRGEELLVDLQEKLSISTLCLVAAERAVSACSFRTAVVYLEFGIRLSSPSWEEHRDLNLRLHNACCEVYFVLGDFDRAGELIAEIEKYSRSIADELRARVMRVYILGAAQKNSQAIDVGLETLRKIGYPIPFKPTLFQMLRFQRKAQQLLKGKSDEAIMRIPMMVDKQKHACMQILNVMFSSGYHSPAKFLLPTIALRMVCLTLEHGLSSTAPVAFALYGGLMVTLKKFAKGQRFGKLALALLERLDAAEFLPRVYAILYSFIFPWSVEYIHMISPLKQGFLVGLETGDVEYATSSAGMQIFAHFNSGTPLGGIRREIVAILDLVETRGQVVTLHMIKPFYQMIKQLMDRSEQPSLLKGDVVDGEAIFQELKQGSQYNVHLWIRYNMCLLAYVMGDFARAESYGRESMVLLTSRPLGTVDLAMVALFNGLSSLAMYKQQETVTIRSQRRRLFDARRCLRYIRFIAANSPHNALGQLKLLEAEYFATIGRHRKALELFRIACGLFTDKGFPLGNAIGHELWARYLIARDADQEQWEEHVRKAHKAYDEWGASVKVGRLIAEFPLLHEEEGRPPMSFYLPRSPG